MKRGSKKQPIQLHEFGAPIGTMMDFLSIAMALDEIGRRMEVLADGADEQTLGMKPHKLCHLHEGIVEAGSWVWEEALRIMADNPEFKFPPRPKD